MAYEKRGENSRKLFRELHEFFNDKGILERGFGDTRNNGSTDLLIPEREAIYRIGLRYIATD